MMNRSNLARSSFAFACAITVTGAFSACSSSNAGPAMVTQSGRMIEYVPCSTDPSAVAGATVTVGSETTTTAKDGTYKIQVPAGVPFTMEVTKTAAPSFAPLTEAENTVAVDYNRGDTRLIATSTAQLLSSALPNYDATRATLAIELVKTGSCTDLNGATVSVSPTNAGALTQYPASCISPVGTNAFATDGTTPPVFPTAVVYDLAPGSQTVKAVSPKCTQIPFPYTDPATGLTYDGTVTTKAGGGTSFIRVFMK